MQTLGLIGLKNGGDFMTTRIFILEDSLIFEKTICEILEETKPLWKPMEYEIIHDFNPAQFMEFVRANEIRSNDLFFWISI